MNSSETKKINWIRILRPIALALVLVFLLSYATYAWLKRDWTPTIHQENVKIVAGSSLTFVYGEDQIDDIAVNTLLNMPEFVFKSVSNFSGESDDFFTLNYSTRGEFYDTFNSIDEKDLTAAELGLYENKYTAYGRHFGYIELKFHIASDSENEVYDKEIYLDGSYVRGVSVEGDETATALNNKAANAVRISVTVHGTGIEGDEDQYDRTVIYAKSLPDADNQNMRVHQGINNRHDSGYGYAADGVARFDTSVQPPKATTIIKKDHLPAEGINLALTQEIKTFDALADEYLFVLGQDEQRAITVRIWLEGEDPDCQAEIAGSALDLYLKFSAKNVVE